MALISCPAGQWTNILAAQGTVAGYQFQVRQGPVLARIQTADPTAAVTDGVLIYTDGGEGFPNHIALPSGVTAIWIRPKSSQTASQVFVDTI